LTGNGPTAYAFAMRFFMILLLGLTLSACVQQTEGGLTQSSKDGLRVLVLGDSLLASNRLAGKSVAQALADQTGAQVDDRSVIGARFFYALPLTGAAGMKIPAQFRKGDWDVIVMNGGGNDVMFGCGCGKCAKMVDRLIGENGTTGAIPELVARLQPTGAKIVFVGYLRSPGFVAPVEHCGPIGDEMDRRLARMDSAMKELTFLPMSDLVPEGDRSYHGLDLVHPSAKGSAAIAARIARVID
jgi:acyl-CoA thioesterase-1